MILDLNNQEVKNTETSGFENLNLSEEVEAQFYNHIDNCRHRYDHT
jgi:hypothetical protein